MDNRTTTQILILGAGYAGMMTALRLAGKNRKRNIRITLVNASDHFVERLRLHEAATGKTLKPRPIQQMLRGTGVCFVQGCVKAIDTLHHAVNVQSANEIHVLPYDKLVIAMGSRVDQDGIAGVREHARVLNPDGAGMAGNLQPELQQLQAQQGCVVVVGGGATGIEAAAQIKGLYPQLRVNLLTERRFGTFKNEDVRQYFVSAFQRRGIPVHENSRVTRVESGKVKLDNGTNVPFDLCLWAGGFKASSIAMEAGLKVNDRGQILVTPHLQSVSHPDIYAVGDAAQPVEYAGAPYRMSVFAALVSGAHVADNLTRWIKGQSEKPLSFAYYGQGIALGPGDGIGFGTYPADEAKRPYFTGRAGAGIRDFFVWFLVVALEIERRIPGFFYWRGRYAAPDKKGFRHRSKQRANIHPVGRK